MVSTTRSKEEKEASEKILSTQAAFKYCSNNMPKITFFHLLKLDIEEIHILFQDRYNLGQTVTGTRSFYCFCPLNIGTTQFKRVSAGEEFEGSHSFFTHQNTYQLDEIPPQTYVASKYDVSWWIGFVQTQHLQEDILVSFLHPHGPSQFFHWPSSEDSCWVPLGQGS